MGAKTGIDIEHLLVWAYREQEVDRRVAVVKEGNLTMVSSIGSNWPATTLELGARVDVSGSGTRLAWQARTLAQERTADDALTIHDAVLALDDVWVEMQDGEATLWTPESAKADGLDLCADDATLRPATPNGRLADFIHARLDRVVVAPLLIQHARAASRPDWHEGWSQSRASAWRGERDRWGRLRGNGRGLGEDRPEDVARDRAVWLVWRAALAVLAIDMEDRLAKWAPTGPLAPESPWELREKRIVPALVVQPEAPRKLMKRRRKMAI